VYPELHNFCAADLSAFYFDIRKDAIYCDRPDSLRRRAARTVLDHLHRCLTTWLAPVLCFTAEEAWGARFGDADSVHLQLFPTLPAFWRDDALGLRWREIRLRRQAVTANLEDARRSGLIGASLQAWVTLVFPLGEQSPLSAEDWAEILIVSGVSIAAADDPTVAPELMPTGTPAIGMKVDVAPGTKCVRCWRVLEEVGHQPKHSALCARCADAVESGLVCRPAA
jgi:isoleucyl-tRNA synthetase